jgi:O-antigen ligase
MYIVAGFITSSVLLFHRAIISNTGIIKLNKEFFTTMFFAICLVLTGKRAHLLFGVIAFCVSYIMIYNRGNFRIRFQRIIKFFIAFSLVFIVALNIPAFQVTFQRFMRQQVVEGMMIGRVNSKWIPALELFKENPLFGCGWQQFGYLHPTYNSGDEIARNVHNIYIQLLCETGIVGFLLIIGIMVITFIMTLRKVTELRKQKIYSDEFLFLSFSFSYQLFFLLYGITGNPLYDIQTLFPYMLCCNITYKYCTRRFFCMGRSK